MSPEIPKSDKNSSSETGRHLAWASVFLMGLFIGLILFFVVYGFKVLDPTNDDWLMMDRDITQHYMGWLYYRASDWHFPIGLIDGLSAPYKVSVVYLDSIPLFAVFFKLLSPLLPATFQYIGIFGLISFGLMGGFSALLIYYLSHRPIASVLFSMFFTVSPYILQRMFLHTALAAHWVIICAMLLWVSHPYRRDDGSGIKNTLLWSLLFFVTSGIHLYLVAMVYIFCFSSNLEVIIKTKKLKYPLINLIAPFIVVIANLALLGAFYGESVSAEAGGFGIFGAVILTFFDAGSPEFTARLLPNLPEGMYQTEGYGYLGAGILLLCLVCIVLRFITKKRFRDVASDKVRFWLFFCICIILYIWAVIPTITIGENIGTPEVHYVFTIMFPKFIYNILSVLRCNGRFIWPVCYIIFTACIVYFLRVTEGFSKKIIPAGIIAVAVGLQLFDLSLGIWGIHTNVFISGQYTAWYKRGGMAWDYLLEDRPHVVYMKFHMERGTRLGYAVARKVLNAGGDINTFYLARDFEAETIDIIRQHYKELAAGHPRNDVIYVFPENARIPREYNLNLYLIDEVIVGLANDAPEVTEFKGAEKL